MPRRQSDLYKVSIATKDPVFYPGTNFIPGLFFLIGKNMEANSKCATVHVKSKANDNFQKVKKRFPRKVFSKIIETLLGMHTLCEAECTAPGSGFLTMHTLASSILQSHCLVWDTQIESSSPDCNLAQPRLLSGCCRHFGSDPAEGRHVCLSLSTHLLFKQRNFKAINSYY